MNLTQAKSIAGTLGFPSKMPGTAYALPASKCIIGAKLVKVPGSVCHGCYALSGMYSMGNAQKAMKRRLAGLSDPAWVDAMIFLLRQKHATPEFRIDLGLRAVRVGAPTLAHECVRLPPVARQAAILQGVWHPR